MDNSRFALDLTAFGIVVGTIIETLPSIAAAMSILWLAIQIYDWVQAKRKVQIR
jgi:hypothetical protein